MGDFGKKKKNPKTFGKNKCAQRKKKTGKKKRNATNKQKKQGTEFSAIYSN